MSEEDISKLGSDLLLFKASAAHNLPVMCQGMAVGADKLWCNPDDKNRTHLHQAIISVSSTRGGRNLLNYGYKSLKYQRCNGMCQIELNF